MITGNVSLNAVLATTCVSQAHFSQAHLPPRSPGCILTHTVGINLTTSSSGRGSCVACTLQTDHALVRCKLRMQPKNCHQAQPKPSTVVDTSATWDITHVTKFQELLTDQFSSSPTPNNPGPTWSRLKSTVLDCALADSGFVIVLTFRFQLLRPNVQPDPKSPCFTHAPHRLCFMLRNVQRFNTNCPASLLVWSQCSHPTLCWLWGSPLHVLRHERSHRSYSKEEHSTAVSFWWNSDWSISSAWPLGRALQLAML